MPCLKQFPLRADIPQCTCPCLPHSERRMGSRTIPVSILGTCLHTPRKGLLNWNLCQSISLSIPKIQTLLSQYSPSPHPCGPQPLTMFQLYTAPFQSVYSDLGSWCRHQQNTMGTSVWNCSYMEEMDDSFLGGSTLHFIIASLFKQSTGQSAPTYTSGWPTGNIPYL